MGTGETCHGNLSKWWGGEGGGGGVTYNELASCPGKEAIFWIHLRTVGISKLRFFFYFILDSSRNVSASVSHIKTQ